MSLPIHVPAVCSPGDAEGFALGAHNSATQCSGSAMARVHPGSAQRSGMHHRELTGLPTHTFRLDPLHHGCSPVVDEALGEHLAAHEHGVGRERLETRNDVEEHSVDAGQLRQNFSRKPHTPWPQVWQKAWRPLWPHVQAGARSAMPPE